MCHLLLSHFMTYGSFIVRLIQREPEWRRVLRTTKRLSKRSTGQHSYPVPGFGFLDPQMMRVFYKQAEGAGLTAGMQYVYLPSEAGKLWLTARIAKEDKSGAGLVPFITWKD